MNTHFCRIFSLNCGCVICGRNNDFIYYDFKQYINVIRVWTFSFDSPASHLLKISDLLPSYAKSVNPIIPERRISTRNWMIRLTRFPLLRFIFIRCSCVVSLENFGFTTFCHFVCEVRKSYRNLSSEFSNAYHSPKKLT